jgi:hypothetical protein
MQGLLQDLRYGTRMLGKQPELMLMVVLTLASSVYTNRAESKSSALPIAFAQTTVPPTIDV